MPKLGNTCIVHTIVQKLTCYIFLQGLTCMFYFLSYFAVSNIDNIQPHKVQWKKRSEELQSRINELEEENALLKQQLEQRPSANQG